MTVRRSTELGLESVRADNERTAEGDDGTTGALR
jgi:hypothetical protein